MPSVCVIIPVYNAERTLAKSIESVLAQSLGDWQLLISDDNSTDNSVQIARGFAAQDSRVRVISTGESGRAPSGPLGPAHAVARAHEHVDAPLVAWLDSDDWLDPRALERTTHDLQARPQSGMVYTDHLVTDELGNTLGLGQRCEVPYSKERLLVDFMTFHLRVYRRELFERVGGVNTSRTTSYDYDFCLKVSEVADIVHLREPLYYYRRNTAGISISRRVEQIENSAQAVRDAIVRRGLSGSIRLDVEVVGRFALRPVETGAGRSKPAS